MDLIAISYENIWPFQDKLLTIFFDKWNFLIKAPIGTWKSFLFFDGPIYALYKYSSRNVLNIKSKSWFIKLLFSVNNENYLIIRNLKSWKSKDSCASRLFKINGNSIVIARNEVTKQSQWDGKILENLDIQNIISKNNELSFEEISFKNETDLQQSLASFLPEREVFLSTAFLMQDAPNIFELQPAERLSVLKSVFGLLSIDDATEIISEKRKEIQTQIKVFSDDSSYNSKLKSLLSSYISSYNSLSKVKILETLFTWSEFIQELSILVDKLNINDFKTTDFPQNLSSEINTITALQKEKYQKLSHEAETFNSSLNEEKKQVFEYKKNEEGLKIEIENLEKKIWSIDQNKLKELKEKKLNLINSQKSLNSSVSQNQIFDFFQSNTHFFDDMKIVSLPEINLEIANTIIEKLKNKWLILKSETNTIQAKINNVSQQKIFIQNQINDLNLTDWTNSYKLYNLEIDRLRQNLTTDISKLETEISSLNDKEKNFEESLKSINDKIIQFQNSFDTQKLFHCEKIENNCPFIEKINKRTFDELLKQKNFLDEEKINLENKIKLENLPERITKINKEKIEKQEKLKLLESKPEQFLTDFLGDLEQKRMELKQKFETENFNLNLQKLEQEKSQSEKNIIDIKSFLEAINWKQIQYDYEILSKLQLQEKSLDQSIITMENESAKIEEYKLSKEKAFSDLKNIQENIKKHLEKISKLEIDVKNIKNQIENFDYNLLLNIEETNQTMSQSLHDIEILANDFQAIQVKIKDLQEDEKIIKELYKVFSKELLLVVLQDSLPILNDIINSFLNQVVDYQIKFQLEQTANQLELQVQIFDEKWERDVKSLSGWQRVILKLVRMLAISSFTNSKILFLDETINNLDVDTVWKVADMLTDFVKSRSIKLYTVTHSQQIHDMKIWDEIIEI